MRFSAYKIALIQILLLLIACQPELIIRGPKYDYSKMNKITKEVHQKVEQFVQICQDTKVPIDISSATRIDSVSVDHNKQHIDILFTKHFSYIPFRLENVEATYSFMKEILGKKFRNYSLTIWSLDQPIEELIPNYYRSSGMGYDQSRMPVVTEERSIRPIVRQIGKLLPNKGLYNRNIGLWHSHGWYYENKKDRWEWQRPRLFQTVEDLLPMSVTIPYLIPMLENAGAHVFVPRERDIQTKEVVIDNDTVNDSSGIYRELTLSDSAKWQTGQGTGFAIGHQPYKVNLNPFRQGTYRLTHTDSVISAKIEYIPKIPVTGTYSVSVSYHQSEKNTDAALYSVYHAGGVTQFQVNQKIGGPTWVYLGEFKLFKGLNPDKGKVTLVNQSEDIHGTITADAVRFGGGMGNVSRNGRTSDRPRFVEGSRYYLQYAGMPDTLVYNFNRNKNDYNDDYQSRPEYINYLNGAPAGPNIDRSVKGLGIPMDLSMAFHTDAGITTNDTTVGSLMIYSIMGADTQAVFPDGMSRMANRDFADIVQTQILEDIKKTFDPSWTRRSLMNSRYSEAYRPNVPGILLELLSHQNFTDMQYIQDPRFRFLIARSIYKGILKFLSFQYAYDYTVQPLPVNHFSAEFDSVGGVQLKWRAVTDPLETSAMPERYCVYTRIDSGGFDNGFIVNEEMATIPDIEPGKIYSFKITALNEGGESFPSEILVVYKATNDNQPILIVNGFDRICGPAVFDSDKLGGFANFRDEGIPDKYDISFTGQQYDFEKGSKFRLNDAPGHGASYADYETKIVTGNTFDYPYVHGKAISSTGHSFVSCSDEAVGDSLIDLRDYKIIDWILGEEKTTGWPGKIEDSLRVKQFETFEPSVKKALASFAENGGSLLVSGAYVGTDLFKDKEDSHPDPQFGRNILKCWWVTDHACRTGKVFAADDSIFPTGFEFEFNTTFNPDIYKVESPDALGPQDGGKVILRYTENEFSAGVVYQGSYKTVVLGFPIETIISEKMRNQFFRSVIHFFENN